MAFNCGPDYTTIKLPMILFYIIIVLEVNKLKVLEYSSDVYFAFIVLSYLYYPIYYHTCDTGDWYMGREHNIYTNNNR